MKAALTIGFENRRGALEVMTGNALVVPGRRNAPPGERRGTERGEPRGARSREVFAGWDVIRRCGGALWRQPRVAEAYARIDIELHAIELFHAAFGEGDETLQQRLSAVHLTCRIVLEEVRHLDETLCAGQQFVSDLPHACVDASQVAPAPRVELFEIQLGAVVVPRPDAI